MVFVAAMLSTFVAFRTPVVAKNLHINKSNILLAKISNMHYQISTTEISFLVTRAK